MLLALVVSVALGQTMYEWTDAQGEPHFTDDLGTVPKGAKVRTTSGADISVVKPSPPPTKPTPGKSGATWDTCEVARRRLEQATTRLDDARRKYDLEALRYDGKCSEIASRFGAEEEARCLKKGKKASVRPEPKYGALESDVERAQEALRRAQVSGCSP